MVDVVHFERFEDYVSFTEDFANANTLLNFFLIQSINNVLNGKLKVHNLFNIIGENNKQITVLHTVEACLIYANDFDDQMILKLSGTLEFSKFNRYVFAGNKQVIDALFKLNQAEYSLQKHRIIYKCKQVNPDFIYSLGKMLMGDM